ncbi:DUF3667 domain-containing protein [Aquimarina longa]|uniref:DUF3667 domain-containing protein n=1 Tax=Aquimarina longa TaxID=1080221 RepID=UPI0007864D9F|nr:DUF3667 domain-containing protein [Aquimarina longa]
MKNLIAITACKNCDQQIENCNFCPNCGAKKITQRITFKYLVSEFANRFFNIDNSFIKTCTHLFTKPEKVIDGYINGLRKRYITAFGYFTISLTVTSFYTFLVKDRFTELIINTMSSLSKEQIETQKNILDGTFQYQSIINLMLIPVLALLSRLVFINYKKYNLTEHLVIYLYAYSHIVGFMTIILLPITFLIDDLITITILQFSIYITYIAWVLKKLYQISISKILIKTLLFIIYGSIFYIVIVILIAALAIMTGTADSIAIQ